MLSPTTNHVALVSELAGKVVYALRVHLRRLAVVDVLRPEPREFEAALLGGRHTPIISYGISGTPRNRPVSGIVEGRFRIPITRQMFDLTRFRRAGGEPA